MLTSPVEEDYIVEDVVFLIAATIKINPSNLTSEISKVVAPLHHVMHET